MKSPYPVKQIVVNNVLVSYYQPEKLLKGPWIVFLHGWRSDSTVWFNAISPFIGRYNLICMDLPGFGASQVPVWPLSIYDYRDIVLAFIRKIGLKNVVLVGHSFGGRIAVTLAAGKPEWLKALVLVDSAGIQTASVQKKLAKAAAKIVGPLFSPDFMQPLRHAFYRRIGAGDYVETPYLKQTFVNVVGEDLTPLLSRISAKTLILWGDHDSETPVSYAHIMHEQIKNSRLTILSDAGHFCFLDKPVEFGHQLELFLKSV
jgi:pimeloyl-ACP methyl ester carboxylesterase